MAQPKIRKHVSYFRNLHKDIKNKDMFNKEPTLHYGEHPDSYNYDKNLDTTGKGAGDVALRRRSRSPYKQANYHQMNDNSSHAKN